MKRYVCPHCGKVMYDEERSTRFRCAYCKEFVEGYEKKLHEKIEEAIGEMFENGRSASGIHK